ncbi:hypothetical protein C2G38_2199535 [Gigaspora rosea]|uniref:Uncharacterized protein n=1 Tax=Gigaspora rosea TaxID=44941 RepID=A0A397URK7_9GLOM|nr:hypothetical protein C2G38_2199535 [Gigaspora rosea]
MPGKRTRQPYEDKCKTTLRERIQDHPTRTNARPPYEDECKTIPQERTQDHPMRTHTRKPKKQEINISTLGNQTRPPYENAHKVTYKDARKDAVPRRKSNADACDETPTMAPTTLKTKKNTSDDTCDK